MICTYETLRDYQKRSYTSVLESTKAEVTRYIRELDIFTGKVEIVDQYQDRARSVLCQLPTGAGKTPLSAAIIQSAYSKGRRVWFMVPRNELLSQGSEKLTEWGVPHGKISANMQESRAYLVHVVSKDTLLRRLDRIKNWPDILIIDECHIALDAQLKIIASSDAARNSLGLSKMFIIGDTATPERLDGRGLWSGVGGPYDLIAMGPSIPWLTAGHYLSPLRYYAPPLEGLDEIDRRGTEYDGNELDELLKRKKIYGDVVGYYEKYGLVKKTSLSMPGKPTILTNQNYSKGKPALIFCRTVKSAYDMAKQFQDAGFNFHCIEGKMSEKELKLLIQAHRDGKIDGLTNCEMATYGLDIPRIEYGASVRPTESRSLYFQKIGRILRPFHDRITGYEKQEALFFDHVNLIQSHQDPRYPGVPLFLIDDIEWNFEGSERRKRLKKTEIELRLCPHLDYQYCDKPSCAGCSLKNPGEIDARKEVVEVVEVKLEERKGPIHLSELQPEEKREIQDRIGKATSEALAAFETLEVDPEYDGPSLLAGPIGELVAVANELNRSIMWVYWHLTDRENKKRKEEGKKERMTVNVPLVYEIARQARTKEGKPYHPYWAKKKIDELRRGIREGQEAVV